MKLIVFDVDGTLVDSQRIICAAMQQAYGVAGLQCPSRARLLSIVGLSLPDAFMQLGGSSADFPVARLVESYKQAFFDLRQAGEHEEVLFPGARETVETFARQDDVLLGIATGKSQRGVRYVLDRHGLRAHFSVIKTADDAPSKPHPGMLLDAMRETGVAAHDTIMVGDSIYDMEMASAAGARAIGVAWGYHPSAALRQSGADVVAGDYAELTRHLLAHPGREPSEAA